MRRLLPVLSALLLLAPLPLGCSGDSGTSTDSDGTSSTTDDSEGGSTGEELCVPGDPITKSGENKMESFGVPCTTDADCKDALGDLGVCIENILDLYTAPKGYCTLDCVMPDGIMDPYDFENEACGTGNYCIGANGFFTACVPECQTDEECWRDGYVCRLLPQLGAEGDPKFCLMPDVCGPDLGG